MADPDFLTDTRTSYDAIAEYYTQWVRTELDVRPVDRALITAFAELVGAQANATIADIGCGPGRVTSYLANRGADAMGVDLSPEMINQAKTAYPQLHFEIGSMLALEFPDASLGGIIAWYSIIHVPDDQLPQVFAEFRRVLVPGGHLLLGFQVGDEISHRDELAGTAVSLDFRYRSVADVAAGLEASGFDVRTEATRQPEDDPTYPEKSPQGYVLARNPTRP